MPQPGKRKAVKSIPQTQCGQCQVAGETTYLKCHDNSDCLLRESSLKHTPHSRCAGMQGDLYVRRTRTGGGVGRGIRGANLRPQRDRDTLQPVNSNRARQQDS